MTKILCISDSPKLTTGFGNVAREIYQGFHEAGFEVTAFGFMDDQPDIDHKLPYAFWPSTLFDPLGHQTIHLVLNKIKPDLVFILCDPGNLDLYTQIVHQVKNSPHMEVSDFPILAYVPIEGFPVPSAFARTFDRIQQNGKVVLYSPGMVDLVHKQYPDLELDWAYHGVDHADFRKYDTGYRNYLRYITGLSDYFVIGSFGVNKRTKGFDTLIYTARCLRDLGQDKGIKFYLHTAFNNPTMNGYLLDDLADKFGVKDMFLWKPESNENPGGNIRGIPRETGDFFGIERPEKPEDRKQLFSKFSYIDRMNCLDLYVDAAEIEGWGLPAFEAMACGVPTVSIDDHSIRREIYTGAYILDTLPFRLWRTWHTGVKLAAVDPEEIAKAIVLFREHEELRESQSKLGIEETSKFKWEETQQRFVKFAKELTNEMS